MKLEFRGDRSEFTAMLKRNGIYGVWKDLPPYQKQYRVDDGAIVNWYADKGTVMIQGVPEAARTVRVLLEKILCGRLAADSAKPQRWSEIDFGKYEGCAKTLPEVALSDPNYIGYLLGYRGSMQDEFEYVSERAQCIRIPRKESAEYEVRHEISERGR